MGLVLLLIVLGSSGWAYAQQVEIEDALTFPLEGSVFPIGEYRVPSACQREHATGDTKSGEVLFNMMKLYREATQRLSERDEALVRFGIVDLELKVPMPETDLATLRLTACGWKSSRSEEYRHVNPDDLRPFLDLLYASLLVARVKARKRCAACEDSVITPLSFTVSLPGRAVTFRYRAQWRSAAVEQR
ncbi:hypothetical protein HY442_01630 [Candidatus Parcubacteria bacterium]|nr:hypothetical protein [Candidatus Parcubacteria bacterium]MBI4099212.1 hypothetical protein [Candidatus Parcubacteria bacterium]MBI4385443.1 hypothetical protein [Candidatus Parcubacteria bacterium]